jgi:pilus assembly protein CpaB
MIQRQKLIGIIASIVLAGIGTGLLVAYVRGAEDRALKGEQPMNVLVVKEAIPKGTKVEDLAGKIRTERVPAKVVADGALSSVNSVAGQVTAVELLPGDQLVASRFMPSSQAGLIGLPPGLLQVTVSLDPVRALAGEVREGDTVGVLVSFDEPETTRLILHKVPVTRVRSASGSQVTSNPQGDTPTTNLFVTLALDGPNVEKVVFAAEHGRLWLSAEPKEANEGGTKVQTKAAINA